MCKECFNPEDAKKPNFQLPVTTSEGHESIIIPAGLTEEQIELMRYADIEDKIRSIIEYIGEEPNRDGLLDTPKRVRKSWDRLFGGYKENPEQVLGTTFENDEKYSQMVGLKDIEFYSTCEHHMIPFFGKVKVFYIPNGRIVGISKLARLVEVYARRLQVQERLTNQIAYAIQKYLKPKGVGVVIEAKHMCMVARGVEKQNSSMVTSCLLGEMLTKATVRAEFLSL